MGYSIAIRTLGTSGEKFVKELDSIKAQTIQPDKIVIYIAKGCKRPDYTIGIEQYVEVEKGMIAQRALPYDEIDSPYLLLLDDDVELAADSMEKLLHILEVNDADCVAVDSFKNHKMSFKTKVYAAITNLVFPHCSQKWAFKIHHNGSFSYINNPVLPAYPSQSAAGPASLWRKDAFLGIKLEDEMWLERFGFAFGEDLLLFNKLHRNGGKLMVAFESGVVHLDAGSSSSGYKKNVRRYYVRSAASFMLWWRTCYDLPTISKWEKLYTATVYSYKALWLMLVNLIATIIMLKPKLIFYYIKGQFDGYCFVKSREFKLIPKFIGDLK